MMTASVLLNRWLGHQRITASEFARRIDYDRTAIHRVLHNQKLPTLTLAAKIEKITEGEIKASSWINQE